MKQYLLLFTLVISAAAFGQQQNGTIYFKDGSTKSGVLSLGDQEVILRKSKKDKEKIKYSTADIIRVEFVDKDKTLSTFLFKAGQIKISSQNIDGKFGIRGWSKPLSAFWL